MLTLALVHLACTALFLELAHHAPVLEEVEHD